MLRQLARTCPATPAAYPSTSVPSAPSMTTEMMSVGLSYGAKPMKNELILPSSIWAVPVLPATCTPWTLALLPVPWSTTPSMASFTLEAVSADMAWPRDLGCVVEITAPSGEST